MNILLVGTLGTTIGHRFMGAAGAERHRWAGHIGAGTHPDRPALPLVPAVIWDRDSRGLHDKVPNTVIVRTR